MILVDGQFYWRRWRLGWQHHNGLLGAQFTYVFVGPLRLKFWRPQ